MTGRGGQQPCTRHAGPDLHTIVLVTPRRCRLPVTDLSRCGLISLAKIMPLLRISAAMYVVLPPARGGARRHAGPLHDRPQAGCPRAPQVLAVSASPRAVGQQSPHLLATKGSTFQRAGKQHPFT